MKRTLWATLFMAAAAGCGTDDLLASCQQVFTHDYAAGCADHDLNTQPEIPRDTIIASRALFGMVGDSNSNGKGDPSKADSAFNVSTPNTGCLFNGRRAAGAGVDPPMWINPDADLVMGPLAATAITMGFEISIGATLQRAGIAPAIAQMGIDGSTLEGNWLPTSTFMLVSTGKNLFDTMIARMQSFEKITGRAFSGLFVSLGTNDAGTSGAANAFQANMTAFNAGVRAVFGRTFPIVWIKTNINTTGGFVTTVRKAQVAVAALDPFLFLVENDECALISDLLHYTANSYLTIGNRAGMAMLDLRGRARRDVTVPTIVGWGPGDFNTSANVMPTSEADVRDGDLELLLVLTGTSAGLVSGGLTGGWTLVNSVNTLHSGSGIHQHLALFKRPITEAMLSANNRHTTPTVYSFSDAKNTAKLLVIRGPNLNPTISASAVLGPNTFGPGMTIPGLTTIHPNELVIAFSGGWCGSSPTLTLTNGVVNGFALQQAGAYVFPATDRSVVAWGAGIQPTPNPTGNIVATYGANAIPLAIVVSIRP